MRMNQRLEKKYHLDLAQYYCVRNAIRQHMVPDTYSRLKDGRYLVRSLYFDTADFQAYTERNHGLFGRIKLRIRTYCDQAGESPVIVAEIKSKKGNLMEKYGSLVPYSRYLQFLQSNSWQSPADPVLNEFERLIRVRMLQPQLLVQYWREGYRCRQSSDLRITLDHNVHSARAKEVFPGDLLLKPHRPRYITLEIKTPARKEPAWLQALVRQHGLRITSNSKYVQGIEVIRPNMITPRPVT
ncbi:MAG: polyphosphate polymerase domain-containing protein [Spirochaetaceae bacterium]|nr:MAG: polyphosphate polymerase domain-containing protein [Spirochaetaceae bacterium]